MLNIKLLAVGKIKEKFTKDEISEYLKRLSKYAKVEIIEVEDCPLSNNPSSKEEEQVLNTEAMRLSKYIKDNAYVFLLDLHGSEIDSVSLANKLEKISLKTSNITFIIGGSLGVGKALIDRANFRLKLSEMTFTHQMTRVIILEQIYRCFKINNHETYHK